MKIQSFIKNGVVDLSKSKHVASWGKSDDAQGLISEAYVAKVKRPRRKDGKLDKRYRSDTLIAHSLRKLK